MRRIAWSMLALALLACRPGGIPVDDEASSTASSGESGSSSTGSSDASSSGSSSVSSSEADASEASSSEASSADASSADDVKLDLPGDPTAPPEGCVDVDLLDAEGNPSGPWSGWVLCEGAFFRVEAIDCPFELPYETCDANEPECSECLDGESCLDYYGGSGYCFCGRNCTSDLDCGRGEICVCAAGYGLAGKNTCLPADCDDELDCDAIDPIDVPHCRLSTDLCGSPESLHCRTELDACIYDQDCPDWWCRFDGIDMRWTCDQPAICE